MSNKSEIKPLDDSWKGMLFSLSRFYKDGLAIEDFKFWAGLAKKKFMGLNYTSMF